MKVKSILAGIAGLAAVAFDYSGRAGALNRITIKADGTVAKSSVLKSLKLGKAGELVPIKAI